MSDDLSDSKVAINDSAEAIVPEVVPLNPAGVRLEPLATKHRTEYAERVRVKDPEVSQKVMEMARVGLSKTAVAILCGLTRNELYKHYLDDYERGQSNMEHIVAAAAMEQVMAGNPQMIMFVAKTKLGWSEHNVIEHTGTVNAVVSARPLSREEFEKKYLNNDANSEED